LAGLRVLVIPLNMLNAWDRIDRVLPRRPWGDGRDGDLAISSNTTLSAAAAGFSGNAGDTVITVDSASSFANGMVVKLRQMRGSHASQTDGNSEVNQIISGGGTTTLTLKEPLHYSYSDSGVNQAQIMQIRMYKTIQHNSGFTFGPPAWDGNTGGNWCLAWNKEYVWAGTVDLKGKGFRGGQGWGPSSGNTTGRAGEGRQRDRNTETSGTISGEGGGGSGGNQGRSGGGGGGNKNAGSNGIQSGTGNPGQGGGLDSAPDDLNKMYMGPGGGAGGQDSGETGGDGTAGGALGDTYGKKLTIASTGYFDGDSPDSGTKTQAGTGGTGAGASWRHAGEEININTNKVSTTPGVAGASSFQGRGGQGSYGRAAFHYSRSFDGTSNRTFYQTYLDKSLKQSPSAAVLGMMM
jgi:hypothetical protein